MLIYPYLRLLPLYSEGIKFAIGRWQPQGQAFPVCASVASSHVGDGVCCWPPRNLKCCACGVVSLLVSSSVLSSLGRQCASPPPPTERHQRPTSCAAWEAAPCFTEVFVKTNASRQPSKARSTVSRLGSSLPRTRASDAVDAPMGFVWP